MSKGWLVNDWLTCIPNTKTLWHFLLEGIPDLEDKTGHPFSALPYVLERNPEKPAYIIRNATFFRRLNISSPTISLVQDVQEGASLNQQIDVCNNSEHVVFNTQYLADIYSKHLNVPYSIIPLGSDSDLFKPTNTAKSKNTILFMGSTHSIKGFNLLTRIIEATDYQFIIVLKEGDYSHPRAEVHKRVDQTTLNTLMNRADVVLCTSTQETQHLAGIESCLADTPVVANKVGIYEELKHDQRWGTLVESYSVEGFVKGIEKVLNKSCSPRQCMIENNLTIETCINSWKTLVDQVKNS